MGVLISIIAPIIAITLGVGFVCFLYYFLRFLWGCLRGEDFNPMKGWWD